MKKENKEFEELKKAIENENSEDELNTLKLDVAYTLGIEIDSEEFYLLMDI